MKTDPISIFNFLRKNKYSSKPYKTRVIKQYKNNSEDGYLKRIKISSIINKNWQAYAHYTRLKKRFKVSTLTETEICKLKGDGVNKKYNWCQLYRSLMKEGYNPEKFAYPLLYNSLRIRDGNHRIALLAFLKGEKYEIQVVMYKKSLWLDYFIKPLIIIIIFTILYYIIFKLLMHG